MGGGLGLLAAAAVALALAAPSPAAAGPARVGLGLAERFAVTAGTTVTSAGVSTVTGDIGVSPGTAVTGFPPGILHGAIHTSDADAVQSHADGAAAYADAVGRGGAEPILGDLGGRTLGAGVYAAGASLGLAGTLTLDGEGDPGAVFVLKAGSTLLTAAGSDVVLVGGAQACNVVWQVGSSATLGASSSLAGSILAATSISMGDGVTIDGRALARDGAVTLINDTIAASACASGELSNTTPSIVPFDLRLTGRTVVHRVPVGAWSVDDATGGHVGYRLTVSATRPTGDGSVAGAGTGAALTLTHAAPTAGNGDPQAVGPLVTGPQALTPVATTIATAAPGTGKGTWLFPAGGDLGITIPADARAGAYTTTLTYTTAPPAA